MGNELQLQESQQLAIQVDVANKYPRQLATFVDDVFNVVVRDPDFAMSCIYCVPVGKNASDGSQTFAMGPSVRLSEEMQKYWKHLRIAVNCTEEPDKIIVQGLIMDCQSNNAETLTATCSTSKWSERRKELKLKAMQSVMKRDLRISIMGKSYADELIQKVIDDILSDKVETWEYCKAKFQEIGVDEKILLNYHKVDKAEELTSKQIYQTIGMYNFLKDNGSEADYLFGSVTKPSSRPMVTPDQVVVQPAKQPAPAKKASGKFKSEQKKPETVMGDTDFEKMVFGLLLQCGHTEESFSGVLDAEFSIQGGIKNIPADLQSQVIDYLTNLSEQTGA